VRLQYGHFWAPLVTPVAVTRSRGSVLWESRSDIFADDVGDDVVSVLFRVGARALQEVAVAIVDVEQKDYRSEHASTRINWGRLELAACDC
jgi:hypothetical protein